MGDNAEMCIIELVDYNENLLSDKSETKVKKTRRRGGKKTKSELSTPETTSQDSTIQEIEKTKDVAVKKEEIEEPEVLEEENKSDSEDKNN